MTKIDTGTALGAALGVLGSGVAVEVVRHAFEGRRDRRKEKRRREAERKSQRLTVARRWWAAVDGELRALLEGDEPTAIEPTIFDDLALLFSRERRLMKAANGAAEALATAQSQAAWIRDPARPDEGDDPWSTEQSLSKLAVAPKVHEARQFLESFRKRFLRRTGVALGI